MIHRKSQLSVPKTRNPYIRYSIYCKPYYILGSVLSFIHACGGFPGASRPFQEAPGPPGPSRGLQGPQGCGGCRTPQTCFERKMRPAAYSQSPEPWARLKFHAGWSGWTRPPTMAGGGGWQNRNNQRRTANCAARWNRSVPSARGSLFQNLKP